MRVAEGFTLGVDVMLWYNINQDSDPVQFQGPNVMYVGRIRLSQAGSYTIRARYYTYDAGREAWTPGPVATGVFEV